MKVPIQSYINCNLDLQAKERKKRVVEGIVQDILTNIDINSTSLKVLDVGSGLGDYSLELAKYVKEVVGVEPDKRLYDIAQRKLKEHNLSSKVSFVNSAIEDYKGKCCFDLVISLTTFEHMPDQEAAFNRIFELMHEESILYFTAPNRLWPFESHYRLYFLSWLPINLANLYVRITGRGESYEDSAYSKTYWGTRKFFDKYPCSYKFVTPDPNAFHIGWGHGGIIYNKLKFWGINLIKRFPVFWSISKGFIIVIKKKTAE